MLFVQWVVERLAAGVAVNWVSSRSSLLGNCRQQTMRVVLLATDEGDEGD